ncbi:P-loop containing nucleoside triphosphate hydrolase protein [Nemania serpens]|nr:P-loop containing nucleoside triphosphate hydrolase protein [Nemania serpens]
MADQPIRIAVFGRTGAGKTSFIHHATGVSLEIGNGPRSVTKQIHRVDIPPDKVGGRSVTLIDTPGFNDTDLEDPNLFLEMVDWLAGSYRNGETLNGAIFVQGINEVRVLQGELDGLKLFQNMVGAEAFSQVIVVTTMWDKVNENFGVNNENNRASYWEGLVTRGAKLRRFYNTEDSALEIVRGCLEFPQTTLLLQRELMDRNGRVRKTSAAEFLQFSLGVKIDDIRQQIRTVGSNNRLANAMGQMRNWLSKLKGAVIKLGASAWVPFTIVGMIVRVWAWEMQAA